MLILINFTDNSNNLIINYIKNYFKSELNLNLLILLSIISIILVLSVMDLVSMAISSAPNSYFSELWSYDVETSDLNDDFPPTEDPVWILGIKYSSLHELEELRNDIKSRIWITYRKNFVAIGGPNGHTTDSGWGCMLRCGQMALAQALCIRHMTREWRWTQKYTLEADLQYREVLKLFEDKKTCIYSIHQIAQMGASEGKPVGNWFGPNTIAQVLKKLSAYDKWNNIVIHVAMDNMVVINEIKNLCKASESGTDSEDNEESVKKLWKPLVLFIPLRLGLTEINPIYFKSLKTTFVMKQSLGIIGGRPNHALYFIGCVANDLVYLDPHSTQQFVDLDEPEADDSSYHCPKASRMDISLLDPSIALSFYCDTEEEFDNWCHLALKLLILVEKQALFELTKERPPHWPQYEEQLDINGSTHSQHNSIGCESFTELEDNKCDSDEEFELLG